MALGRGGKRANAKTKVSWRKVKKVGRRKRAQDKVYWALKFKEIETWGFHCFRKGNKHSDNERRKPIIRREDYKSILSNLKVANWEKHT